MTALADMRPGTSNLPGVNVTDYLLAGKDANRVAVNLPAGQHTYGELARASFRIAAQIRKLGCKHQDRVLLIADNSLFWIVSYLGIVKGGAICVPLSPTTSSGELRYFADITGANIVFAQRTSVNRYASVLMGMHVITDEPMPPVSGVNSQRALSETCTEDPGKIEMPSFNACDLAALMFTSGSTGKPRGVMISHKNIIANTESIVRYLELTASDRIMVVLPFHYCFGTSLLHTHLRIGASVVVDSRFMYPEAVLQRMLNTECTGFAGVPSHFQILLRNSSLSRRAFPHLRYVQQAGGHLAPSFVRQLRAALPMVKIYIMYGQTEATARLSYLPPELVDVKPGSIGKGMPGVTLRVVNEIGLDVRPGESGEIVAQGENVAAGYWRAPEESASCFRDGVLHTGDIATVDSEGFIYIVDRAKEIIKCGGKRVSCRRLEDCLLESEELLEAAVIAIPDDVLGEAAKAYVVPRAADHEGLEARLAAFCRTHLAPEWIPREIVVVPALPKNSAGKVLKSQLKAFQETGHAPCSPQQ